MPSLFQHTGFCLLALFYFSLLSESFPQGSTSFLWDHPRHSRDVPPSSYADPGKTGLGYSPPIVPIASLPGVPGPPLPPTPVPQTITQESEDDYNGTFKYSFLADNDISVSLSGRPKTLATGEVVQTMEGEYFYIAPDGTPIVTRWYADDTGFHAEGDHIPGSRTRQ